MDEKSEQLSPRRRSALVTYLAILFAAAFLFVALMMVIEAKRLKTMNQELQDSSQKTSASLTSNINALQAENQRLSEKNSDLNVRIGALEEAAAAAETENAALQAEIDRLTEAAEAQSGELERLQAEIDELTRQAADAVTVSELLHQAMAADESGDLEGLQALLDQIEPLADLLSLTEAEIYEELKIA
jgi:cell division protein FtsL